LGIKLHDPLGRVLLDLALKLEDLSREGEGLRCKALRGALLALGALMCLDTAFALALAQWVAMLAFAPPLLLEKVLSFTLKAHLGFLGALFNLFRGKKYNTLKGQMEPAAFDVDQVFVGSIVFVGAAFLAPTVIAFNVPFVIVSSLRAAVASG